MAVAQSPKWMSKIYHSLPRRGACAFVQLFQAG
jgi:hypothetical protein